MDGHSAPPPRRVRLSAQEGVPQHDRIVVKFVARGEYERDRAFACRRTQFRQLIGMIVDLGRVAPAAS